MPISSGALHPPGSVIVVPFPYSDRLAEKRRPALVVSGSRVEEAGLLWITMTTGARNPTTTDEVPIVDLGRTGLTVASKIRFLKLACIEPSRVVRRIGALASNEAEIVFDTLRGLVGGH